MHCANRTSLAEPEGLALLAPAAVAPELELPDESPPQAAMVMLAAVAAAIRSKALLARRCLALTTLPGRVAFICPGSLLRIGGTEEGKKRNLTGA
jgi:hypothetical protein